MRLQVHTFDRYFIHLGRFDMAGAQRTGRAYLFALLVLILGVAGAGWKYTHADKY